jgi:hypothetical protein
VDNAVIVGLMKTLEKQIENDGIKLAPGKYDINTELHIKLIGSVVKGENYDRPPTVAIPWTNVLAFCLQKMGCTRESSLAMLAEAIPLVLNKENVDAISDRMKDVAAMEAKVKELTSKLPKQPCAGKTTVKLTIEELSNSYKDI